MSTVHEDVQNYYGQQLQHSNDLKTDACCSKANIPPYIKEIIRKIHPEVLARWAILRGWYSETNRNNFVDIMDVV